MIDHARLKAFRIRQKMTQEELARKAEVGFFTFHRIESGYTKDPSISNVAKIAKALDVRIEDLLIS